MSQANRSKRNACVIGTSDFCSRDPSKDVVGGIVVERLKDLDLFREVKLSFVGNDYEDIKNRLKKALVEYEPVLIITIGGTGFRPRDVTPEATSSLYEKYCSGIVTALHMVCLRYNPNSAITRLTAGIINNCLVINFPASEKACKDCMKCLEGFIQLGVEQIRDNVGINFKTIHALRRTQFYGSSNNVKMVVKKSPVSQEGQRQTKPMRLMSNDMKMSTESLHSRDGTQRPHNESQQTSAKNRNILNELLNRAANSLESQVAKSTVVKSSIVPKTVKEDSIKIEEKSEQQRLNNAAFRASLSDKSLLYPFIEYFDALVRMKEFAPRLKPEQAQDFDLTKRTNVYRLLYSHILAEDLATGRHTNGGLVATTDGYLVKIPDSMMRMFDLIGRIQADLVKDRDEFEALCSSKKTEVNAKFYCHHVRKGDNIPEGDFVLVPINKADLKSTDKVVLNELTRNAHMTSVKSTPANGQVIKKGTIIGPVELGTMLSLGIQSVKTWPKPKIGILSIGNNLRSAFDCGKPGEPDIVSPVLGAMLGNLYKYQITQLGVCDYDLNEIKSKLLDSNCDVLIVTGNPGLNVTMLVDHLEARILFGLVDVTPELPAAFCSIKHNDIRIPIFMLPKEPELACMASLVLVLPFLEQSARQYLQPNLSGLELIGLRIKAKVVMIEDDNYESHLEQTEILRAHVLCEPNNTGHYPVAIQAKNQANSLLNLKNFNCIILKPKEEIIQVDSIVVAYKLDKPF